MQKVLIALLLVVSFVMVSSTAVLAANQPSADKLSRGLKNTGLGWTEIPKQIRDTSRESNAFVGVTVGLVKGVLQAFARTVSGVVDVATFPVGSYDRPAIKPTMISEGTK